MKPTRIEELPDDLKAKALAAFASLADNQKGDPELMGGACNYNPAIFHARGIWTHFSEHVGDLTHRMAQRNCDRMNFGAEWVGEKVRMAMRELRRGASAFASSIDEQIDAEYRRRLERGDYGNSLDEFRTEFAQAAKRYANAHRKLVVYNAAQWHAREAAVALGERNYPALIQHIQVLADHLERDWLDYAGSVVCDGETIREFPWTLTETVISLRRDKEEADSPVKRFLADYERLTQANDMLKTERIYGGAWIQVSPDINDRNGTIRVGDINSWHEAGKGHGRNALKMLCAVADKHGVKLTLLSKPYGPKHVKPKDLKAWYERYGFKVKRQGSARDGYEMLRLPVTGPVTESDHKKARMIAEHLKHASPEVISEAKRRLQSQHPNAWALFEKSKK